MPSSNRDRIVDCMEEFVKYTIVMRPFFHLFEDRFSEREEKRAEAAKEKAANSSASTEEKKDVGTNNAQSCLVINGVNIGNM